MHADPFAGFDMAPKIEKTKRHEAKSVFAKPNAPTNSRFAMLTPEIDEADAGGSGWGDADDDLGDFGASEKRRAAEERRKARREQRGEGAREKRTLRVAAVKVVEE